MRSSFITRAEPSSWKPNNSTPSKTGSPTSVSAPPSCGGIFDYDQKADQLKAVARELEDPKIWDNAERAQELGREKRSLENVVLTLNRVGEGLRDAGELFAMAREEATTRRWTRCCRRRRHRAGSLGARIPAHVQQPGRPAQLLRRHPGRRRRHRSTGLGGDAAAHVPALRERKGYAVEVLEESEGEVAGIKTASIKLSGDYAYGMLRSETGIHRLVRKSPFDSNARRHTSFCSVTAYPEIDDSFEVDINPADLRIDTYRASGAGGQHINKTDSAVRITHLPTNIVVQCQNDRSQHRNRAEAMAMLKSRIYEAEMRKRQADQQKLEDAKSDIGWGHQIRSYVLDQSRIKDLRTNVEVGNTQGVLDGDLDQFIEASLKQGV
jgi:peptide chain release factor 2